MTTPTLATQRPPAINSYGFLWNERADHVVSRLAAMGYREFELMLQPPHLGLGIDSPEAQRLREMVRQGMVEIHALNMPSLDTNLASPFAEMRAYSVAMFKRKIELASSIGVPFVVTVPGRLSPLFPAPRGKLREWMRESIAALIPFARERGVRLAVENIPMASFPRADELLDFISEINSPVLGVCYDVANAHFVGEDPVAGIELFGDRLSLVHFSDTTRSVWRHDPLGAGEIHFGRICNALARIAYSGPLVLEIIGSDPIAAIRQSHAALQATGHLFPLGMST